MTAKLQGLPELRWDDVRVFLAAYRFKSFGLAGSKLGVDTSTVSRRIAAFEEALGMLLFDRSRDGLLPTAAAEVVLESAESMESAQARLLREATGVKAAAAGTVRVSALPGLAELFVAPMLLRLRKQHPDIDVELDVSVRAVDLTRHEADLALRAVASRGAELIQTKLVSAPSVVVGAPALVRRLGKLDAWCDAPWIGWDKDTVQLAQARWMSEHAAGAQVPLRTSHFASQISAAESGLGLLLLPKPYLHRCCLVPVRVHAGLQASAALWPTDYLWLVGHRALRDVPRVAVVWNFFAEEFRKALPAARTKR